MSKQSELLGAPPSVSPIELARVRRQAFGQVFGSEAEPINIGRYEVRARLGEGGMGAVYLGYDPRLRREVAIKLVRGAVGRGSQRRLIDEGRSLAAMSHPHIVPVYEVGLHRGAVFVVMQRVVGATLTNWLSEGRPSWHQALTTLLGVGDGVGAAHRAGLIHRDIKPSNIMVRSDGAALLIDFGLALHGDDSDNGTDGGGGRQGVTRSGARAGSSTQPGTVMGTPAYMAPEVKAGRGATRASDQFAFARTVLDAITHCANRDAGARVPSALRRTLRRALRPDPEKRWPTMGALIDKLRRHARPAPGRRALVTAVGALSLGAAAYGTVDTSEPCDVATVPTSTAEVVAGLHEALSDSPRALANTVTRFGRFNERWTTTRAEACAALEGDNRRRALDCLERAALDTEHARRALSDDPDRGVSKKLAVLPPAPLPDAQACLDPRGATAGRSAGVAAALASATTLVQDPDWRRADRRLAEAVAEAKATHDAEAEALLRFHQAAVQHGTGRIDQAHENLIIAYGRAVTSGRADLTMIIAANLSRMQTTVFSDPDAAESWLRHGRAAYQRGGGATGYTANLENLTGEILRLRGRFAESEAAFLRADGLLRAGLEGDDPLVLANLGSLALLYAERGDADHAVVLARTLLLDARAGLGDAHPGLVAFGEIAAEAALQCGDGDAATQVLAETNGPGSGWKSEFLAARAAVARSDTDAKELSLHVLELLDADAPADQIRIFDSQLLLVNALLDTGELGGARRRLGDAEAQLVSLRDPWGGRRARVEVAAGDLALAGGDPALAAAAFGRAIDVLDAHLLPAAAVLSRAQAGLARARSPKSDRRAE